MKKGKIADRYLGIADGKLEDLFTKQTEVIDGMGGRYAQALEKHMTEFENLFNESQNEIVARKTAFMEAIEAKFSIEEVHDDFSNLRKLNNIEQQLVQMISNPIDIESVKTEIRKMKIELEKINSSIDVIRKTEGIDNKPSKGFSWPFGHK